MRATDEMNQRYVRGLCVNCGTTPHSAGRPRCFECHSAVALAYIEPELTRKGAK